MFLLSLTNLPDKSSFNVMTFGTTFKELFPSPQQKSKVSVDKAASFVEVSFIIVTLRNTCMSFCTGN